MKMKALLCSAAVCGLAIAGTPAHAADGLKLDVGGYFKGYGMYTSQDDATVTPGSTNDNSRSFDIIRNTEIHFGGETTLDNGLTVGFHTEAETDNNDGFGVNETYAYFSGGWGRVNFGSEDGAAYLLQVEAPSADDNVDGLRQFVNPINYLGMQGVATVGAGAPGVAFGGLNNLNVFGSGSGGGLDYDQDVSGNSDKLTYLSPIWNGFQAGVSYTPDVSDFSNENAANFEDVDNRFGAAWDVAARYEGQWNNVGVILGGGYSRVNLDRTETAGGGPDHGEATDDRTAWNLGADFDIGPFGIGAAYMHDNLGDIDTLDNAAQDTMDAQKTWVVGGDYTTGPFKLGLSYLHQNDAAGTPGTHGTNGTDGITAKRWTGGLVYTYGPGMTFRGSVSRTSFDDVAGIPGGETSPSATSVLLGTQVNF